MKFKKTLLTSLVLAILSIVLYHAEHVYAAIIFKPNIPIPGSELFGGGEVTFDDRSGTILALYIRDLYNYGASLAGVVALFMLVFAGWKWLMAAGSSEKVAAAKSVINNVLVGLLLLFGGYLLLSQISDRLVNLRGLVTPAPYITPTDEAICSQYNDVMDSSTPGECGGDLTSTTTSRGEIICLDNSCDGSGFSAPQCINQKTGLPCPVARTSYENSLNCRCVETDCSNMNLSRCSDYQDKNSCNKNICYNQITESGEIFDKECGWINDAKWCDELQYVTCDNSSDCNQGPNGNQWCCSARTWDADFCEPIEDTPNCKQ